MFQQVHIMVKFFIVIFCLLLASCASLIPKPHEMPAPDKIYIHQDPRVGDYAVYLVKSAKLTHRYEVVEVNPQDVVVRYRMNYIDPDYKQFAPKEWYYRKITLHGDVLKAWAVTDDGQVLTTPVAKTGEIGSLEHLSKIDKKVRRPIVVKKEAFNVDAINSFIYRSDVGLVSVNSSCMEYYSDQVPFKILKREFLNTSDVGAFLTTVQYLQVIGEVYLTENYMKLYNKATQGDMKYQSIIELVDYGYGR